MIFFHKKNLMDKTIDTIAETLLFRGLPKEHLQKIAQIAAGREYEKGELVFSEGETADGFYVVEEGSVKIFKVSLERDPYGRGKLKTTYWRWVLEPWSRDSRKA